MKYMSSIIIYSDFDPASVELSALAREAEEGAAICSVFQSQQVEDKDLPQDAASFFQVDDE